MPNELNDLLNRLKLTVPTAGNAIEKKSSLAAPLAEAVGNIVGRKGLEAATGTYADKVLVEGSRDPGNLTQTDMDLIGKLRDKWTNEERGNFIDRRTIGETLRGMGLEPTRQNKIDFFGMAENTGPFFTNVESMGHGGTKSIYMPLKEFNDIGRMGHYLKPGVLAHEMGHGSGNLLTAQQSARNNLLANAGSSLGFTAGLLASPFASTKTLGVIGGIGTGLSVPRLAEELRASWRGYNMLRDQGADFKTSIGAFAGVPTYMAAGAAPLIPVATKAIVNSVSSKDKDTDKDKKKNKKKDMKKKATFDLTGALRAAMDATKGPGLKGALGVGNQFDDTSLTARDLLGAAGANVAFGGASSLGPDRISSAARNAIAAAIDGDTNTGSSGGPLLGAGTDISRIKQIAKKAVDKVRGSTLDDIVAPVVSTGKKMYAGYDLGDSIADLVKQSTTVQSVPPTSEAAAPAEPAPAEQPAEQTQPGLPSNIQDTTDAFSSNDAIETVRQKSPKAKAIIDLIRVIRGA